MTNIWKLNDINALHIELTNACNAGCPQCSRFIVGTAKNANPSSISIEDFKKWFSIDFVSKLEEVMITGNQGDPIMCKDLIPIVKYIIECSPSTFLHISTNGGVRDTKFWAELGQLVKGTDSRIVFGIDGLRDTNHLYRRNVDWDRLMLNASTFIENGGKATWQFILFKHNEHQIEEAKKLAKDMGFVDFATLNAFGFENTNTIPAYSKTGKIEYMVEPATVNRNDKIIPIKHIEFDRVDEYQEYIQQRLSFKGIESLTEEEFLADQGIQQLAEKTVQCKSLTEDVTRISINAKGETGPCCFVHSFLYLTPTDNAVYQLKRRHESLGPDAFNLRMTPLPQIIDNLNAIYALPQHVGLDGRVLFCSTICSKNSRIDKIFDIEDEIL